MKKCSVCLTEKPLSEFRKYGGRSRDGLRPLCKPCQREYEKKWRSQSQDYRKVQRAKRKDKAKIYAAGYIEKNRAAYLISSVKRRCQKKGIPFDLDLHEKELSARISLMRCEITGFPLRAKHGKQYYNSPSIDRIDPLKGYLYSNVRIVCFAINAAMGQWGLEKLETIIKHWKES